jgi:hypothetical protein
MAHPTHRVLILSLSSAFRTDPSADSGKKGVANEIGSAKFKIAIAIDSGSNNVANSTKDKENETCITISNGRSKESVNEANLRKREEDTSSHEKPEEPSGECNNNEENREDECEEPKEVVPSISVSDVEIQLKNLEITPSKTRNIEVELNKLTVAQPEVALCERSPIGSEKCHRSNYSPYSVSSSVYFSVFLSFVSSNTQIVHGGMVWSVMY